MQRTEIREIFQDPAGAAEQEITVCGWARSIRASNAFGFIEMNDGSCFGNLQIVFEADKISNYAEIARQNVGAALEATGTLVLTPGAKQPFELKARAVRVEGASAPDYPRKRKSIRLNFCAPSRICVRAPTHLTPYSVCAVSARMRSTAFFTSVALCTLIRRLLRLLTARERAKCSA